jgi:hypothetical protein
MQAVRCRVCGKREWNHVCRGSGDEEARPVVLESKAPADRIKAPGLEELGERYKRRTEYMKEYMRRRRGVGDDRARCEACGHLLRLEAKGSRAEYMREYRKEAPSSKESRARLDRVTGALWLLTAAVELMARGGFDRDIVLGQLRQVLVTLGEVRDEQG